MDKVFVSSDEVSVIVKIKKNRRYVENEVIKTAKNFLNMDIIKKTQVEEKLKLCSSLSNVEYYNPVNFTKFINGLENANKLYFFKEITPIIEYLGEGAFIVEYMPNGGIYKLFD